MHRAERAQSNLTRPNPVSAGDPIKAEGAPRATGEKPPRFFDHGLRRGSRDPKHSIPQPMHRRCIDLSGGLEGAPPMSGKCIRSRVLGLACLAVASQDHRENQHTSAGRPCGQDRGAALPGGLFRHVVPGGAQIVAPIGRIPVLGQTLQSAREAGLRSQR